MKQPIPIMFMSDSPATSTGLGRITQDLALHVSTMPEYRVATFGRGEFTSSKLPFAQYVFSESSQWGENYIENAWHDFAANQVGIIMTIWDLSRLDWFSRPKMGGDLQKFLDSGRFQRWAYVPIDHYGVNGGLTSMCADTLNGFDRILAYTIFGKGVIESSIGREVDWIPHGFDGNAFKPRNKQGGRLSLGVSMEDKLIGCVMTNQARKDWGTAFYVASRLKQPGWKFWFHADTPLRHWNMYALVADFGLQDDVIITTNNFTSAELSELYSACDITFLPSLGEGFGYPIIESLACGIPVVHGNYGGGAELIPEAEWIENAVAMRIDTQWNCIRPVWDMNAWAERVRSTVVQHSDGTYKDICTNSVEHLKWKNLWPAVWKKWFQDGLK